MTEAGREEAEVERTVVRVLQPDFTDPYAYAQSERCHYFSRKSDGYTKLWQEMGASYMRSYKPVCEITCLANMG